MTRVLRPSAAGRADPGASPPATRERPVFFPDPPDDGTAYADPLGAE